MGAFFYIYAISKDFCFLINAYHTVIISMLKEVNSFNYYIYNNRLFGAKNRLFYAFLVRFWAFLGTFGAFYEHFRAVYEHFTPILAPFCVFLGLF